MSLVASFVETIFNSILCSAKKKSLQTLLAHIQEQSLSDGEKCVLQKYIDRYSTLIVFIVISFVTAAIIVALSPLFLRIFIGLMNIQFSLSVYSASWIGKSQKMKNNILIMLQRSQKPFQIFMGALRVLYYLFLICSTLLAQDIVVTGNILSETDHDMAIIYLKFNKLLHILRVVGTFTNTWPPPPNLKKNERFFRNLYFFVSISVLICVCIPVLACTYINLHNVALLMKNLSQVAAFVEAMFNSILCRAKRKSLQSLLANILEQALSDEEKSILQKYIDRYSTFIVFIVISFVTAGITAALSPLFQHTEFPLESWYPFSTEPLLPKICIHIMQMFTIFYTVACVNVDIMMIVFIFYSTAKLEVLACEVQRAADNNDVVVCIKNHQEIIKFLAETQLTIKYLLFKTNLTMGLAVLGSCIPILYVESHFLIPQFLSMIIAALQRLYLTAWPANDLKEVSMQLALSTYSASWIGKSQEMKNNILIMLQRSQKPFQISMGALLPVLNLQYFVSFVSAIMSYFMTMRAVLAK